MENEEKCKSVVVERRISIIPQKRAGHSIATLAVEIAGCKGWAKPKEGKQKVESVEEGVENRVQEKEKVGGRGRIHNYFQFGRNQKIVYLCKKTKSDKMGTELIPQDGDTIICLKVGKIDREDLYEMTRKYWKMSLQRASKANHVLAVVDGIVKEDYIPQDWKYTDNPKYEGRIEFVGNKCLNSPYVGKSVVSFYGKSQNPVKYINM